MQAVCTVFSFGMLPIFCYITWGRHVVTPLSPLPSIGPLPDAPPPPEIRSGSTCGSAGNPLIQVAKSVQQAAEPSSPGILAAPSLPPIGRVYEPADKGLLQFLLNDFVGGKLEEGRGYRIDQAVTFLRRYVERYCALYPDDREAQKVQRALYMYVYCPDNGISVKEAADEFWRQLEEKKILDHGRGRWRWRWKRTCSFL